MISLNWFIPALVNINVGSSLITIGAEGTIWWPLLSKKLLKESLISFAVNILSIDLSDSNLIYLLLSFFARFLLLTTCYLVLIFLKKLCKDSLFLLLLSH